MELPCPHCGALLQMGPPLQAHIAEQHAGAAEAAKEARKPTRPTGPATSGGSGGGPMVGPIG